MKAVMKAAALLMLLAVPAFAQTQGSPTFSTLSVNGAITGNVSGTTATATGGTTARTLAARSADIANVLDFGADATGVADSSTAFGAAAATNKAVYAPAGTYRLNNSVTLTNGQCLYGEGHATTLKVDNNFSSSATGVIILSGLEQNAPCVRDLSMVLAYPSDQITTASAAGTTGDTTVTVASASGIVVNDYIVDHTTSTSFSKLTLVTAIAGTTLTLSQPLAANLTSGDSLHFSPSRTRFATLAAGCTVSAGGTGCKYPPAILANAANRFNLRNLWITGAWDGIVGTTAGRGGADIHNVTLGAFDVGFDLDGMNDFLKMSDIRFGSFGFSATDLGVGAFADGSVISARLGRVDGMTLSNFVNWLGSIVVTSNASSSEDTWTWNGVVSDGGPFTFTGGYNIVINGLAIQSSGYGTSQSSALLSAASGRVFVIGATITTTSTVIPISQTGGSLSFTNSYLSNDGATAGIMSVSGGGLHASKTSFVNHNATGATPALVQQSGSGTVDLTGNAFGGGSGSPIAISYGAYSASNYFSNNILGSYLVQQPGAVAGAVNGVAVYTTPGTYTYYPTPGAKAVTVTECGAGGGGGGGALVASGTAASGGGGGGGGVCPAVTAFRVSDLTTAGISIQVGQGGTGGIAATSSGTAGSAGTAGTDSRFASYLVGYAGGGGSGGQIAAASAGGAGAGLAIDGGNASGSTAGTTTYCGANGGSGAQAATNNTFGCAGGGSGSSAAGAAFAGGASHNAGAGGAAGGGVTSAPAAVNGGAGRCPNLYSTVPAGGTSGTPNGATFTPPTFQYVVGCSGGGGYGNSAGVAGNAGASSAGSGGSGGGSALNGSTAGAGAAGGNGFVYIVESF